MHGKRRYNGTCDEGNYKQFALQAAMDLNYSEESIDKIERATTDAEIERIMVAERHKKSEKKESKYAKRAYPFMKNNT